ncbi:hypothetical protein ABHN11_24420 [Brevibacillus centrosporus]|uniref:hypothetical protein n=1 Tax=Brevibacillus centrosporus TaxID=54910 RepID=UPI003D20EFAA
MNISQVLIQTQVDIKLTLVKQEYEAVEFLAAEEEAEMSEWLAKEFQQYLTDKIQNRYQAMGLNWKDGKVFKEVTRVS